MKRRVAHFIKIVTNIEKGKLSGRFTEVNLHFDF